MITRHHRNETRADHLLREFKECARRAAHCHTLSRLRILEGNRGAAIFYQLEAAKYHRYAIVARNELIEMDRLYTAKEQLIADIMAMDDPAERKRMMRPLNHSYVKDSMTDPVSGKTFEITRYPLQVTAKIYPFPSGGRTGIIGEDS